MTEASGRIKSVDIFRGLTIALMILVNNPGNWDTAFAPLRHAPWNGLTPTDCVFPFFLFIMGVSMFLSLRKSGFRLSWRVLRRTLLLFAVGLTLNYIGGVVFGGDWAASHLRIMGVLQRFALCYGITAVIVATVDHKWLRWIAAETAIAMGLTISCRGWILPFSERNTCTATAESSRRVFSRQFPPSPIRL